MEQTKQTNKTKIPLHKAKEEVERWLDYKKVPDSIRETNADSSLQIAEAISDGYLVINEDFTISHTLLIPLINDEGAETVKDLTYKARLNSLEIETYMKGVKADNVFGMVEAHICALTGKARGIIKKLDTIDLKMARGIATFFL